MEVIPAIDLLEGNCVRLNQGNYDQVTEFCSDPVKQALIWQEKGASRLHLVDLDGAKTGLPLNDKSIKAITSALEIPVQIGGGIRTRARADELLSYGVDRVILGTVAIEDPQLVLNLAKEYPERIIVGIDAKKGKVATRGWINESNISAKQLTKSLNGSGIAAIITTDISTDGMLNGPNIEALKEISQVSDVPVIASGGVSCIADLILLLQLQQSYGVTGVIIGRALYDGAVDLKEAIIATRNGYIQDSPSTNIFIA